MHTATVYVKFRLQTALYFVPCYVLWFFISLFLVLLPISELLAGLLLFLAWLVGIVVAYFVATRMATAKATAYLYTDYMELLWQRQTIGYSRPNYRCYYNSIKSISMYYGTTYGQQLNLTLKDNTKYCIRERTILGTPNPKFAEFINSLQGIFYKTVPKNDNVAIIDIPPAPEPSNHLPDSKFVLQYLGLKYHLSAVAFFVWLSFVFLFSLIAFASSTDTPYLEVLFYIIILSLLLLVYVYKTRSSVEVSLLQDAVRIKYFNRKWLKNLPEKTIYFRHIKTYKYETYQQQILYIVTQGGEKIRITPLMLGGSFNLDTLVSKFEKLIPLTTDIFNNKLSIPKGKTFLQSTTALVMAIFFAVFLLVLPFLFVMGYTDITKDDWFNALLYILGLIFFIIRVFIARRTKD